MKVRAEGDFGALARQRRRDLGLPQAEVAERAGVTRQWLVRFEQGNSEVSLSKAFAVLRELNLTLRADPPETLGSTGEVPGSGAKYMIPKRETLQLDGDEPGGASSKMLTINSGERLSEVHEKIKRLDETRGKLVRHD